jgi:hypothetical protein
MTLESERGAVLIRTEIAPGSILGLPALVSDEPYTMSAVAKRSAVVSYDSQRLFGLDACRAQPCIRGSTSLGGRSANRSKGDCAMSRIHL